MRAAPPAGRAAWLTSAPPTARGPPTRRWPRSSSSPARSRDPGPRAGPARISRARVSRARVSRARVSRARAGPVMAAPAGRRGRDDGGPGAARAARHRRQAVGRAGPIRRRPGRARPAVHPAQRRAPAARGPVGAALREAAEEVGLDLAGVDVVGTLPEVFIERTGFRVVPVLAWWRKPSAVGPVDAGEVAAVERVSVAELA